MAKAKDAALRLHHIATSDPEGQGLIVNDRAATAPVYGAHRCHPRISTISVYKGTPNTPVKPSTLSKKVIVYLNLACITELKIRPGMMEDGILLNINRYISL